MARRPDPVDPPPHPVKGMVCSVQTGPYASIWERYIISRVNGRSFYVAHDGRRQRWLLSQWPSWLRAREAEGPVSVDGRVMRAIDPWGGSLPGYVAQDEPQVEYGARDARMWRATRDVLNNYRLRLVEEHGARLGFQVVGGAREYRVRVTRDWSEPSTCTCPDAARRDERHGVMFCKHVIAVLLSHEELRCQLLDSLL